MNVFSNQTIDPRIIERLRTAYCSVPPLSARDTRTILKRLVPQASEAELDEALHRAGFADDGQA